MKNFRSRSVYFLVLAVLISVVGMSALRADEIDDLCAKAEAAVAKKDFVVALDAYGRALAMDATSSKALLGRAACYQVPEFGYADSNLKNSKYGELSPLTEATNDLTAYLKLHPDDANAYLQRAWCLKYDESLHGEGVDEAALARKSLADLNWAIHLDPKLLRAYLLFAEIAAIFKEGSDMHRRALALMNAGIEQFPQAAELYVARADYNSDPANRTSRIADYSKALELGPVAHLEAEALAATWAKRGKEFADEKKYNEAIADFDQAVRLAPDSYETKSVHVSRGRCHRALHHDELALADFKQGNVSFDLDNLQHEINLSKGIFTADELLAQAEKESDDAKRSALFAKVMAGAATEESGTKLIGLAEKLQAQGQLALAGTLVQQWLNRKPNHRPDLAKYQVSDIEKWMVDVVTKLIDQMVEHGQLALAGPLAKQALELIPASGSIQARCHVCEAHRLWSEEKSIAHAQQVESEVRAAVKLDSSVCTHLGAASSEAHAYLRARDILDPSEYVSRASREADAGDFEKAIADMTQCLAGTPAGTQDRVNRLWYRAGYYRKLREPDLRQAAADDFEAIRILDKLIEANPNDSRLWGNRGEIRSSLCDPSTFALVAVDLRKAAELSPGDQYYGPTRKNLAQKCLDTALTTDDADTAVVMTKAGAALIGDDSDRGLLHLLAEVQRKTKDYDGVLAVCERLLRIEPADFNDKGFVYALQCQAYFGKQDYDRALAAYGKVDKRSYMLGDVEKYPAIIAAIRSTSDGRTQSAGDHLVTCRNCEGRGLVWHKEYTKPRVVRRFLVRDAAAEGFWHEKEITEGGFQWVEVIDICPVCHGSKVIRE